ncbi:hypothetical protein GCM10023205_48670 [Yinghuangia aomiensis]|uniref:FAD-binding FR-type domain-containing protein n=1 Tax=Yinghuangia aomiensis TaxID=676205 RepID=A0ABP9HPV1_9ACTN
MEAFIAAERVQRAQAYRPFHVTVAANRPLSPNATRITFASADLAHFVVGGPDQRVKLFVPRGPGPAPRIAPGAATWREALEAIPEELRPYQRTYTVRAHRPDPPTIDIDFALHDPGGPASRWARNAGPGDELDLLGPTIARNGGYGFAPSLGSHLLLVGDQAALPAVGAVIESLPADARGHAFVSVPTAADIQHLAAPRGVNLTWLPGADSHRILEAVQGADLPSPTYAWLAGEASGVRALRRHLVGERGVDRRSVAFQGYWRIGHTEETAHDTPGRAREAQATRPTTTAGLRPVSRMPQDLGPSPGRSTPRRTDSRPDPELRYHKGFRGGRAAATRAGDGGLDLALSP